ncbi:hypothetical protein IWZ01DRAFT_562193 [Phyllosticta capitalensis]
MSLPDLPSLQAIWRREMFGLPTPRKLTNSDFLHVDNAHKETSSTSQENTTPLLLTTCRTACRIPSRTATNRARPLLRLPAELRLAIWELVLGDHHIVPKAHTDGRLTVFCWPWTSDFDDDPAEWYEEAVWHRHRNRVRPSRHDVQPLRLDLLLTCKAIYNEARGIPFKHNNFIFTRNFHLHTFCHVTSLEQQKWLRTITILYLAQANYGSGVGSCASGWNMANKIAAPPFTNRLDVHFVTYIKVRNFLRGEPFRKMGMSEIDDFERPEIMGVARSFARGHPETKFKVSIDVDSALMPFYCRKYPRRSRGRLEVLLGVTEEERQEYVDVVTRMIDEEDEEDEDEEDEENVEVEDEENGD